MPVRRNAAYSDPAIGQAFDNLASIFAPPKATDLYAFAKARAARDEADRVTSGYADLASKLTPEQYAGVRAMGADYLKQFPQFDLYRRAGQTSDPASLDPLTYAIFGNAGNTFAGRREAEAAATGRTKIEQDGALQREFAKPVVLSEGQTAALPHQTAAATGLPQFFLGGVKLGQGQTYTPPSQVGGALIAGPDKPLNESEVKAREMADMRAKGLMSDDDMKAVIFGNTPLESVTTPSGPRYMTRPQAIGQQPTPDAGKVSELATLQNERAAIAATSPNDPRITEYDQRIQALGRGQQQGKYDQVNEESLAKLNDAIFSNAQTAASNVGTLNRIEQLMQSAGNDNGKWAGVRLEVRKGLQALGINAGDTSPLEVQRALANKFALQLRDPSQGAGMPGALSDSDRNFLASMAPGIENSPDAGRLIINFYKRLNQRTTDLEQMRRDYVRGHGRIDENFRNQVSDFVNANPLFPEAGRGNGDRGGSGALGAATSGGYPDGFLIENDAGQQMVRRNGKWEPVR